MRFPALIVAIPFLFALTGFASPLNNTAVNDNTVGISQSTFNDLQWYFKYASSAYADTCTKPNGNTLVTVLDNTWTDTQGFIARDDKRREIIVSLRGSSTFQDALIDITIVQVPLLSPGIKVPAGSLVHLGFLLAWNSVADEVIATVRKQLASHPGYSLVTTGHSLGGALSSLAGLSLRQNFPSSHVRMYTYGQPRVFNLVAARFVNVQFGMNAFRSVHTNDGVPTMLPQSLDYHHHGVEYWQTPDPANPTTTRQCDPSGEDPTCSDQIKPSGGINDAHSLYYNIRKGTTFCT